jgi:hypothetical protein
VRKTLIPTVCRLLKVQFLKNYVTVPSKSNKEEKLLSNYFFVGILKVNDPFVSGMDPRIHIRIRIHTKMSWIRNTGFQLFRHPKCKR